MEIRFPRNIRLGFRPVYGLTLRQLLYLAAFATVGGLVILLGPLQGTGLIVRLILGLALVAIGLALAFWRIRGLSLDEWFPIGLRYLSRPRRRVWRKRDIQRPSFKPQSSPSNPHPALVTAVAVSTTRDRGAEAAWVMIEAALLLALLAFTVYLQRGGLAEVQMLLASRIGH